jgi:hypothetical protein
MKTVKRPRRRSVPVAVLALSAFIVNGCHTVTRVTLPDSTPPPANAAVFALLKAGDNVRVTLRTGEKAAFTVAEVQPEGLVATDGRHVSCRDMAQLEERSLSPGRTAALVAGICAAVFVGFIVLLSQAPFVPQ